MKSEELGYVNNGTFWVKQTILLVMMPFQQMMQASPGNLWRLEAADRKAAADLVEDGSGCGPLLRKWCRNAGKADYVQTVVLRCSNAFV